MVNDESKIPMNSRNQAEIRVAGIAHDLNNVLTVISGYAEMLREDLSDNQPLRESSEKILSAVLRARSLTEKLLVSGGGGTDEKTIVNLNDIVAETLAFFRPSLSPEINIVSSFHPLAIRVNADPSELLRVFMNITGNAVRAMVNRGGTLTVKTFLEETCEDADHSGRNRERAAVVSISDTGCGMDQLTLQRIFEPWFSSRPEGSGKGLGLYISGEIINALGGTINASSIEGKGSVFTVSLPLSDTD